MEDEGSAHSQGPTEQAGFKDNIISRRSLTRLRQRRCLRGVRRPIVLSEHECREIDFMSKLSEPFQCGGARIEGCRPGFYVCDVFETACQCLEQLLLLS
jgi:hypothetical protein